MHYDLGIDPQKRFRCLNPKHLDRDPSMGYDAKRQKVHCFACGADYDLFNLLAINENLTAPHDALALASKRYGHGDVGAARPSDRPSGETPPASYPERCFSHRGETDYGIRRHRLLRRRADGTSGARGDPASTSTRKSARTPASWSSRSSRIDPPRSDSPSRCATIRPSPVLKKDRVVSRETCPSNLRRLIFECKTPGRI